MTADLPGELKKLGQRVNRHYPTVNSGGCGVYASLVSQQLRQLGLRPRVLVAGYEEIWFLNDIRTVMKDQKNPTLDALNNRGIYVGHLFIQFNWQGKTWIHDTDHTIDNFKGPRLKQWVFYKGHLTVGEVTSMAASTTGWNESFDRDQIPFLESRVDRFFKGKIFAKSVDSTIG